MFLRILMLVLSLTGFAEIKSIAKVFQQREHHMVGDGFRVFNYFPHGTTSFVETSPFILLDYHAPHSYPPLKRGSRGVGAHAHRGFETVTLVYEGGIAHRDSRGGSGVIGAGDVQWMTAAEGVLHEEFHEKNFAKNGGVLHCVQLWVNLPAKYKMERPRYQTLLSQKMGRLSLDEKGSNLRVIAGKYGKVKGPANTHTPIEMYDVDLKKGSVAHFKFPSEHNSMILVMNGALDINGKKASGKDLVVFGHSGEEVKVTATDESFFLVLSGEPIHEPLVHSGPFVMNTQEEIEAAYADWDSGKFGNL